VWIDSLASRVEDQALNDSFMAFDCSLLIDRRPHGAFITFTTSEKAIKALLGLQGRVLPKCGAAPLYLDFSVRCQLRLRRKLVLYNKLTTIPAAGITRGQPCVLNLPVDNCHIPIVITNNGTDSFEPFIVGVFQCFIGLLSPCKQRTIFL